MNNTLKTPPHSIESEQAVIGGILLDPQHWSEAESRLVEEDFYKPSHQKIFRAFQALSKKNEAIDLVTLSNELTRAEHMELIGGQKYLLSLVDQTHSTAYISNYIKIIYEHARLREIINLSGQFTQEAFDQKFESYDQFVDSIEEKVFALSNRTLHQSQLMPAQDVVKQSLDQIEKLYGQKGAITGTPSGFEELDGLTAGFQNGEFIIIAARPSIGKTAFSLNLALHAALNKNKKIAYFSLEMSKEAVMNRMLSNIAEVPASSVRIGAIKEREWPRLIQAGASLSKISLYIDDSSLLSPMEVRSKARRMKAKMGLDMIIVDYLQLMCLQNQKVESREREVSEISRTLKAVAKELDIPVVALAQLNRSVEGRSDRRPILSDLRESGSIEQDADVIMMLYRDFYYNPDKIEVKNHAEVIVNKQRNGPTGLVKLAWYPEFGRFANPVTTGFSPSPKPPQDESASSLKKVKNFALNS